MSVNITIKSLRPAGAAPIEFSLDVDETTTVEELKEQIASRVELPKENIRLICGGSVWENNHNVGSYGVSAGSVVHCLNNPPRVVPTADSQILREADPMAQMMGAGPPQGGQSADPMQQMSRQMMQNPEMMQQLMSSPMVQQMMSNPETIRAMVRMNPQLSQLMEERPEIARIMEDPEMLQQSMRMMANPSLMREMTRNADRSIGRLDAMPGGHSALRRAHEEYADPLFNAMTNSGGGAASGAVDYTQQSQTERNSAPMANPWGPPAAAATPAAAAMPAAAPAPAMANPFMPAANPQPFGGAGAGAGMGQPNPMMQMMMQNMMQPPAATATPAANTQQQLPTQEAAAGQPPVNPMMGMMQQMQQNPQMMQMMQQMMQNPQMMQNMMQMRMGQQNMGGGAPGAFPGAMPGTPGAFPGAMPGMTAASTPADAATPAAVPAGPMSDMMVSAQRARFASQLSQLAAMGFTDEALCIRVLTEHNGRVDSAMDALLSSGDNA